MSEEDIKKENTDNFYDYYELDSNSDRHNGILAVYYTYTTLSTVGFGDLAPRSDMERLICSGILLIGVGIFSVFLGDFTNIIDAYKSINEGLDETEALDQFFGLIKHFNNENSIEASFEN
jgi:hypothetical protein